MRLVLNIGDPDIGGFCRAVCRECYRLTWVTHELQAPSCRVYEYGDCLRFLRRKSGYWHPAIANVLLNVCRRGKTRCVVTLASGNQ